MVFKICQNAMLEDVVHTGNDIRSLPRLRHSFRNQGRKDPNVSNSNPPSPKVSTAATITNKASKDRLIQAGRTSARKDFVKVTALGLGTQDFYNNPESLASLEDAYQKFKQVYPRFVDTVAVDQLREREYSHLRKGEYACFDYCGFGLFSYWQQVFQRQSSSFNLAYVSANLPAHALYGAAEEGSVEACIRKRIMNYMNLSDSDYCMVFTASRGTAYKLLAESYPFHVNNRLLTVYDYESDAVSWMVETAQEKGAKVMHVSFKWPNLRIAATDLTYKLQEKKKKKDQTAKGLFVFPVQSRVTGAKYSFQWISQAQANKWHVLLDASALAPKEMDSLALSLFRPEFIVTSFYKVFGGDPTGFGCLFIKSSIIQDLHTSDRARGVGMVRIIPSRSSNVPPASDEGQRGGEEQLTDDLEIVPDVYVDAADYVNPVSAFSGPMAQVHADSIGEEAVSDRISASDREMNVALSDDGCRPTFLVSDDEEKDPLHGEIYSRKGKLGVHRNDEGLVSGRDPPGRESGSDEMEEEPCGPEFPLTRRGPKFGGKSGASKEIERHSLQDENRFFLEMVKDPSTEITNGNVDRERALRTQDKASSSREVDNRFLSRIQEDVDECADTSLPYEDSHLAADNETGNNESSTICSPLFCSTPKSTGGFEDKQDQDLQVAQNQELLVHEHGENIVNEVEARSETDELKSNIMFKDDPYYSSREERHAEGSSQEEQTRSADLVDSNDGHFSGAYEGRVQPWSLEVGSSQWEVQYAMPEQGPFHAVGPSNSGMLDEDPVICSGLDHVDSQGLSKINLRFRYLINWIVNALLKLRHPAQSDRQGANLVHIYGPEVHLDRGQAMAFNLFDWNGVPIRTELVQRLADRNSISLGLGTLCNIVYPEGSTDLVGSWFNKGAEVESNDGKTDSPRASNASKHDRHSEISVVTAALGFVSTFEDVYRLWAFVAKFLDADFVKREELLYHSLNQEIHVL